MIITHQGRTIELLGDAHLGKPFIHGVPLHRRGDREKMVWADFERSISDTSAVPHSRNSLRVPSAITSVASTISSQLPKPHWCASIAR